MYPNADFCFFHSSGQRPTHQDEDTEKQSNEEGNMESQAEAKKRSTAL
jgi:hypothetical protein